MWSLPEGAAERVATRGTEWFTTERGFSVPGAERSRIHPDADRSGPGGATWLR